MSKEEKNPPPLASMKEREDWLKERGVQIESPVDRARAAAAAGSGISSIIQQVQQCRLQDQPSPTAQDQDQDGQHSIPFVYIPHDTSKPLVTLQLPRSAMQAHGSGAGDALPSFVQSFFADSRVLDPKLVQDQATKHFAGGNLEALTPNLSTAALQSVTAQGAVETFCLVHPADTNDYTGVYLYLDEVGLLKQLPLNPRASQLAASCGYDPPPQFHGDLFCGRVRTKPTMHNVAFQVGQDTDPSAPWRQRAVAENIAWQQAMNDATGQHGKRQPAVQGTEGASVQEDAFSWTQDEEELEIRLTHGDETSTKTKWDKAHCQVTFLPQSLSIVYQGQSVLQLHKLYAKIDVDGCTWTLDNGGTTLVVTCEKAQTGTLWPQIQLS